MRPSPVRLARTLWMACERLEPRKLLTGTLGGEALPIHAYEVSGLASANPRTAAADALDLAGIEAARRSYGFTGAGQTVAIIDTGIAYDHQALGGGLGAEYRVVGGRDFTEEQDNDPYDDGPAGFHGTHVSGILASSDPQRLGLAPHVNLVGLRVFNDQGLGQFTWVEQALQWVHDHRLAFEFPITTVNLSIGSSWNSVDLPGWATLEDELEQLYQAGILVVVAAGNNFTPESATGLSYPAVSPYVMPVASLDAQGELSDFSQRVDGILAAQGEAVISTVPDHLFGGNGVANDWAEASGTSMAAPLVAGASVLLREAYAYFGHATPTPADLHELLSRTATIVHDPATGVSARSIRLDAAIAEIAAPDDFADSADNADPMHVDQPVTWSGQLGTLHDRDAVRVIAAETGQLNFTLSAANNVRFSLNGQPLADATQTYSAAVEVRAGEELVFTISALESLSPFQVQYALDSSSQALNLGPIDSVALSTSGLPHDRLRLELAHTGILTVATETSSRLTVQDAWGRIVTEGTSRVDLAGVAGDAFYVRIQPDEGDTTVRLVNLVELASDRAWIHGTRLDDEYRWQDNQLVVNGIGYTLPDSNLATLLPSLGRDELRVAGGSNAVQLRGQDTAGQLRIGTRTLTFSDLERVAVASSSQHSAAHWTGNSSDDQVYVRPQYAEWSLGDMHLTLDGIHHIELDLAEGLGHVRGYDSSANDRLFATATELNLSNASSQVRIRDVDSFQIHAINGGEDEAILHGGLAAETAYHKRGQVWWEAAGHLRLADGFGHTTLVSAHPDDQLHFYDTTGDDTFRWEDGQLTLVTATATTVARAFNHTASYAIYGGHDTLELSSQRAGETFYAQGSRRRLEWGDEVHQFWGHRDAEFTSRADQQAAYLTGTSVDDLAQANRHFVQLESTAYRTSVRWDEPTRASAVAGTRSIHVKASPWGSPAQGNDTLWIYDTPERDQIHLRPGRSWFHSTLFQSFFEGFADVTAVDLHDDLDTVHLYDSPGNDEFYHRADRAMMTNGEFQNVAVGFQDVQAISAVGGQDQAYLYDTSGNDFFWAKGSQTRLTMAASQVATWSFDRVDVYATLGGSDSALLEDTPRNETFYFKHDRSWLESSDSTTYVQGFDRVEARSRGDGSDAAFLYDSPDRDWGVLTGTSGMLQTPGFQARVHYFGEVTAISTRGGRDQIQLIGTDQDDVVYSSASQTRLENAIATVRQRGFRNTSVQLRQDGRDTFVLVDMEPTAQWDTDGDSLSLRQSTGTLWVEGLEETLTLLAAHSQAFTRVVDEVMGGDWLD